MNHCDGVKTATPDGIESRECSGIEQEAKNRDSTNWTELLTRIFESIAEAECWLTSQFDSITRIECVAMSIDRII